MNPDLPVVSGIRHLRIAHPTWVVDASRKSYGPFEGIVGHRPLGAGGQAGFIDELCEIAGDEQIHLVAIAGDIFDTANPSAAAEQLFYDALDRLSDGGRRAVVAIAGNHDNPDRLCAAAPLAGKHGIALVGWPNVAADAGNPRLTAASPSWFEVEVPGCDHCASIIALPYPSEARLKEVLSQTLDEKALQRGYSQRVALMLQNLAAHYRPDAVRLAMTHVFVMGGLESESERPIQIGGAYALEPQALPAAAQYVALGHLHRPQAVGSAPAPARYSGSPLAYSFSEAGQAKSVVVVEAHPAGPAQVKEILLNSGRPLVRWVAAGGLAQVRQWCDEGRDPRAWIDLEIHVVGSLSMDEIQDLRRLRDFINIRPIFPETERTALGERRAELPLDELFRRFYAKQGGGAMPGDELVKLFLEMAVGSQEEEATGLDGAPTRQVGPEADPAGLGDSAAGLEGAAAGLGGDAAALETTPDNAGLKRGVKA